MISLISTSSADGSYVVYEGVNLADISVMSISAHLFLLLFATVFIITRLVVVALFVLL